MTAREMSLLLDAGLNSYRDSKAFGQTKSPYSLELDEYEKSTILTEAQDNILKRYMYAYLNPNGQGLDDSEIRQIDFSYLINTMTLDTPTTGFTGYDQRSIAFTIPQADINKVFIILNEQLISGQGYTYRIIPINYQEYDRIMSKPFTLPKKREAWKLISDTGNTVLTIEIIPNYSDTTGSTYKMRYVRYPSPIVTTDLSYSLDNTLNVRGVQDVSSCELSPVIHQEIVNEAIIIALTRAGINNVNIDTGNDN